VAPALRVRTRRAGGDIGEKKKKNNSSVFVGDQLDR